jgi:carbon storage regulator
MLVLTRKVGEKIHVGSGITISVVAVRGPGVRLGIDAPKDVPVLRAELIEFGTTSGENRAENESLVRTSNTRG